MKNELNYRTQTYRQRERERERERERGKGRQRQESEKERGLHLTQRQKPQALYLKLHKGLFALYPLDKHTASNAVRHVSCQVVSGEVHVLVGNEIQGGRGEEKRETVTNATLSQPESFYIQIGSDMQHF